MRNKLLGEPTARQSQMSISAATADIDNDQTDELIKKDQTTANQKSVDSTDKFYVRYTHEQRFNTLKTDMHHVYDETFQNTPAMYTRMIVCTRNRRDAKNELIRKRPKRTLLRNKKTNRECHSQR